MATNTVGDLLTAADAATAERLQEECQRLQREQARMHEESQVKWYNCSHEHPYYRNQAKGDVTMLFGELKPLPAPIDIYTVFAIIKCLRDHSISPLIKDSILLLDLQGTIVNIETYSDMTCTPDGIPELTEFQGELLNFCLPLPDGRVKVIRWLSPFKTQLLLLLWANAGGDIALFSKERDTVVMACKTVLSGALKRNVSVLSQHGVTGKVVPISLLAAYKEIVVLDDQVKNIRVEEKTDRIYVTAESVEAHPTVSVETCSVITATTTQTAFTITTPPKCRVLNAAPSYVTPLRGVVLERVDAARPALMPILTTLYPVFDALLGADFPAAYCSHCEGISYIWKEACLHCLLPIKVHHAVPDSSGGSKTEANKLHTRNTSEEIAALHRATKAHKNVEADVFTLQCCVCMNAEANCCLTPCGHICCLACAEVALTCPVCSTKIVGRQQFYIP
ncbi:hypothetical protein Pelo_4968 [Pelomyxa schiedti]|nr:hypothetical protein Pelo_4968 [Pelomyxa schiedti]